MTRRNAPAGTGRSANRGISAGRKQRFQEALDSVPRLQFDNEGKCVIEGITRQQITGLNAKAALPDRKIFADTGEKREVWTVVIEGTTATVYHNRYHQKYLDRCEYQNAQATIGRLNFNRGIARIKPENDEQREALLVVAAKQGWEVNEHGDTVMVARHRRAS